MSIHRSSPSSAARLLLLPILAFGASCSGSSSPAAPAPVAAAVAATGVGAYLIADQFNNRVIEVDDSGKIVWHFGRGPKDFSPASVVGVNDAQRVGDLTLMAGTGTPGGQAEAPDCTDPAGCPDNRVLLVDRSGKIKWQYGKFQVTGAGPDELNTPVQSTWLPNGDVLITDQANERVIEVNMKKEIVWQYGVTGGCKPMRSLADDCLNNPNSAELLANGHILISDENNDRAIEVNRDHHIVDTFTAGGTVSGVAFSSRLHDGHTLITDANHGRAVEVDRHDAVVWEYFTNKGPNSNPHGGDGPVPTRAVRLANGHTLISDQYEVTMGKNIVRTFGRIDALGYDATDVSNGGLNSPYDAKRLGDFTGLTPPFGHDFD